MEARVFGDKKSTVTEHSEDIYHTYEKFGLLLCASSAMDSVAAITKA